MLPNWPELNSSTNEYLVIDAKQQESKNYPESWVIANRQEVLCQSASAPTKNVLNVFVFCFVVVLLSLYE
jgi:hypothetical protein